MADFKVGDKVKWKKDADVASYLKKLTGTIDNIADDYAVVRRDDGQGLVYPSLEYLEKIDNGVEDKEDIIITPLTASSYLHKVFITKESIYNITAKNTQTGETEEIDLKAGQRVIVSNIIPKSIRFITNIGGAGFAFYMKNSINYLNSYFKPEEEKNTSHVITRRLTTKDLHKDLITKTNIKISIEYGNTVSLPPQSIVMVRAVDKDNIHLYSAKEKITMDLKNDVEVLKYYFQWAVPEPMLNEPKTSSNLATTVKKGDIIKSKRTDKHYDVLSATKDGNLITFTARNIEHRGDASKIIASTLAFNDFNDMFEVSTENIEPLKTKTKKVKKVITTCPKCKDKTVSIYVDQNDEAVKPSIITHMDAKMYKCDDCNRNFDDKDVKVYNLKKIKSYGYLSKPSVYQSRDIRNWNEIPEGTFLVSKKNLFGYPKGTLFKVSKVEEPTGNTPKGQKYVSLKTLDKNEDYSGLYNINDINKQFQREPIDKEEPAKETSNVKYKEIETIDELEKGVHVILKNNTDWKDYNSGHEFIIDLISKDNPEEIYIEFTDTENPKAKYTLVDFGTFEELQDKFKIIAKDEELKFKTGDVLKLKYDWFGWIKGTLIKIEEISKKADGKSSVTLVPEKRPTSKYILNLTQQEMDERFDIVNANTNADDDTIVRYTLENIEKGDKGIAIKNFSIFLKGDVVVFDEKPEKHPTIKNAWIVSLKKEGSSKKYANTYMTTASDLLSSVDLESGNFNNVDDNGDLFDLTSFDIGDKVKITKPYLNFKEGDIVEFKQKPSKNPVDNTKWLVYLKDVNSNTYTNNANVIAKELLDSIELIDATPQKANDNPFTLDNLKVGDTFKVIDDVDVFKKGAVVTIVDIEKDDGEWTLWYTTQATKSSEKYTVITDDEVPDFLSRIEFTNTNNITDDSNNLKFNPSDITKGDKLIFVKDYKDHKTGDIVTVSKIVSSGYGGWKLTLKGEDNPISIHTNLKNNFFKYVDKVGNVKTSNKTGKKVNPEDLKDGDYVKAVKPFQKLSVGEIAKIIRIEKQTIGWNISIEGDSYSFSGRVNEKDFEKLIYAEAPKKETTKANKDEGVLWLKKTWENIKGGQKVTVKIDNEYSQYSRDITVTAEDGTTVIKKWITNSDFHELFIPLKADGTPDIIKLPVDEGDYVMFAHDVTRKNGDVIKKGTKFKIKEITDVERGEEGEIPKMKLELDQVGGDLNLIWSVVAGGFFKEFEITDESFDVLNLDIGDFVKSKINLKIRNQEKDDELIADVGETFTFLYAGVDSKTDKRYMIMESEDHSGYVYICGFNNHAFNHCFKFVRKYNEKPKDAAWNELFLGDAVDEDDVMPGDIIKTIDIYKGFRPDEFLEVIDFEKDTPSSKITINVGGHKYTETIKNVSLRKHFVYAVKPKHKKRPITTAITTKTIDNGGWEKGKVWDYKTKKFIWPEGKKPEPKEEDNKKYKKYKKMVLNNLGAGDLLISRIPIEAKNYKNYTDNTVTVPENSTWLIRNIGKMFDDFRYITLECTEKGKFLSAVYNRTFTEEEINNEFQKIKID